MDIYGRTKPYLSKIFTAVQGRLNREIYAVPHGAVYYLNHDKLCFKIGLKSKTIFKCSYKLTRKTDNTEGGLYGLRKCTRTIAYLFSPACKGSWLWQDSDWDCSGSFLCIILYCQPVCFVHFPQRSWLSCFINKIETKHSAKTLHASTAAYCGPLCKARITKRFTVTNIVNGTRYCKPYLIQTDIMT